MLSYGWTRFRVLGLHVINMLLSKVLRYWSCHSCSYKFAPWTFRFTRSICLVGKLISRKMPKRKVRLFIPSLKQNPSTWKCSFISMLFSDFILATSSRWGDAKVFRPNIVRYNLRVDWSILTEAKRYALWVLVTWRVYFYFNRVTLFSTTLNGCSIDGGFIALHPPCHQCAHSKVTRWWMRAQTHRQRLIF